MRILSLLPLFFRKNFASLIILIALITILSFCALVIMVHKQSLEQYVEQCDPQRVIIKSSKWNEYQRTEIIGVTQLMPEVESSQEVIKVNLKKQIPTIIGVPIEFLEQNIMYLGIDKSLINIMNSQPDAALVSNLLMEKLSIKIHDQLEFNNLFFNVKGVINPGSMIDKNVILVNKELVLRQISKNPKLEREIQIIIRLKKGVSIESFRTRISAILLSNPANLEIFQVKDVVSYSLSKEIQKFTLFQKLTWISILLFILFAYVLYKHEIRKLTEDIAIIHEVGMTKHDFLKLSWGYVIFPTLLSGSLGLILFVTFYNGIWVEINSYHIHINIVFHTFLNWLMYLIGIFACWWIVVYLSFISKTSTASLEDHAKFVRSVIYPEKIIEKSQNTINRAKSALRKLIQKEQD